MKNTFCARLGALIKGATITTKGFTLMELLVVVLIISILAGIALPEYTKAVEKSRSSEAFTLLANLVNAEKLYKLSTGGFTGDLNQLDLELPNISAADASKFSTSDWEFTVSVHPLYTSTFTAFAARAKDGVRITTGDLCYGILLTVDSNGQVTRKCQLNAGNPLVPKICSAISNSADGTIK